MWLQRKDRKDLIKFSSKVFKTHMEKVSTVNLNINFAKIKPENIKGWMRFKLIQTQDLYNTSVAVVQLSY